MLLICIQLKALTLGATLVVCFSIGIALTLVTVGVGAAVSVRQVTKRWDGFNKIAKKAPYFSNALIGCVGIYMGIHGYLWLRAPLVPGQWSDVADCGDLPVEYGIYRKSDRFPETKRDPD